MKTINKMLGMMLVSSTLGLTACQSMSMNNQSDSQHTMMPYQKLNDGQVLKVLSTANNGEIMQAQAALPKLQSAQARNYAQMMINEHSMNEKKGQGLANRLGLMPQASNTSNALQKDSDSIVNNLTQSTTAVDRDYMMSQVKVHTKVLKTIDDQLLPSAASPELKSMLVETRGAVAMHLQTAQQLVSMMK